MNRKELSNILKEHRAKNGVLLKKIFARMDVGSSVPFRIETGVHNYNIELFISYMDAIGVMADISYEGETAHIKTANEIIELIKSIRHKKKLSQNEFAEKIGVSRITIANIERGASRMKIDLLLAIINTFGYELQIIDKEQDDGEIHTS